MRIIIDSNKVSEDWHPIGRRRRRRRRRLAYCGIWGL